MDSSRSSTAAGDASAPEVPAVPKDAEFNDNSKVPFMTAKTLMMTILVSMGGICFGYDTGQISGFLQVSEFVLSTIARLTKLDGQLSL